ncbi:hypothetical protein MMC19_004076 [Ptychographa xylographoides]|nr:hypothetical protein [Ptychographa xylographoides]
MVLPTSDCDDCTPAYLRQRLSTSPTIVFSSFPFLVTFLFVATLVFQKLFPLLSGEVVPKNGQYGASFLQPQLNQQPPSSKTNQIQTYPKTSIKRVSAYTFSATIALATVLAELVLCEISDTIDPNVRGVALRITISLLLILLIIVIPSLELHSTISAAGYKYTGRELGRLKLAWVFHTIGFTLWLLGFWWSGQILLARHHQDSATEVHGHWVDIIVEHVGVIGISLMALLSGFASVSAPWQNFGARPKPVSEGTIARKQAGLDATNDMLSTKRSRLRFLQRKMSDAPPEGFLQKAMGSFRGNADVSEKKSLELEINGLENMALSLSTSHSLLQARLAQQNRSRTALGRLLLVISFIFSIYCLYRIVTTSLTAVRRRVSSPEHGFSPSDPINNILALLVKHYDSHLDRDAWTRQISFLLSGVMLFASFSSVLQTFHFFARFTPSLLKAVQQNLPLIVAQVCATYVISVALLLRGLMPGELVSKRLRELGGTDMQWVDGWFEVWFLGGVAVTAVGIWVGRKIGGGDEWDEEEDIEMGKMS